MAKELLSVQDFKNLPPVNFRIENVASLPTGLGTGDVGRIVYLTTNKTLNYWGGTAWSELGSSIGGYNYWNTLDYNCRYVHASFASLGGRLYSTIQAAIDAADSGDCIVVFPGTYNEHLTIGKSCQFVFQPGAIIQPTTVTADVVALAAATSISVKMLGMPIIIKGSGSYHCLAVNQNCSLYAENLKLLDISSQVYNQGLRLAGGDLFLSGADLYCGFFADGACRINIDAGVILGGVLIDATNADGFEHYIHCNYIGRIVHWSGIMHIQFVESLHNDSDNAAVNVSSSVYTNELTLIDGKIFNQKYGDGSLIRVENNGRLRMKHVEARYDGKKDMCIIVIDATGVFNASHVILDNCTLVNTSEEAVYSVGINSNGTLKNWGSVANCPVHSSVLFGTNYFVEKIIEDTRVE
jgi:hypothetical protein